MFGLISFFIGLFVLFKGGFRLGSRTVAQAQARTIALALIAPLVLEFCASALLVSNNIQINPDETFSIDMVAIANTLQNIDLILVVLALGLVAYTIYGAPLRVGGSTPAAAKQQSGASPTRAPDIMTVAEAAAYMRVTEREVLGLIDQGKLGAARIGDSYRIARIAIEDFMGLSSS